MKGNRLTGAVLLVAVLALIGGILFWTRGDGVATTLELTNLPGQFCPKEAWIVATDNDNRVVLDALQQVDACRFIAADSLIGLTAQTVIVKVARALAGKVVLRADEANRLAITVGDVTGDNSIDGRDEKIVRSRLALPPDSNSATDINADGRVDVIDLALVRIGKKVGEIRPDGQPWAENVL